MSYSRNGEVIREEPVSVQSVYHDDDDANKVYTVPTRLVCIQNNIMCVYK